MNKWRLGRDPLTLCLHFKPTPGKITPGIKGWLVISEQLSPAAIFLPGVSELVLSDSSMLAVILLGRPSNSLRGMTLNRDNLLIKL